MILFTDAADTGLPVDATFVGTQHGIGLGAGVSLGAVGFENSIETTPQILRSSHQFHVIGVDAGAFAAQMVKFQTSRDRAMFRLPGQSVGPSALASFPEYAITIINGRSP